MAVSKSSLMPMESFGKAVAGGDLGQQGEVRSGRLVRGRDAHQALRLQAVGRAAGGDEGVGLGGDHAGLLRLLAGVDLDVEPRLPCPGFWISSASTRASFSRSRVSMTSKKATASLGLVGLQRADQVQRRARGAALPSGPWPPARGSRRTPVWPAASTGAMASQGCCLGDRHQGHVGRRAARGLRGAADPGHDIVVGRGAELGSDGHFGGLLDLARTAALLRAPRAARGRPCRTLLFFTDPARTPDPEASRPDACRAGAAVVFRAFGAADAEARGLRLRGSPARAA